MKQLIDIIKTTAVGGLVLIVPLTVLVLTVGYLIGQLVRLNQWMVARLPFDAPPSLILIFAAICLLCLCLLAGVLVQTQLGSSWAEKLDDFLVGKIPVYGLIQSMTRRFSSDNVTELSPAEISLFGNDTRVLGFIMEQLPDNRLCVFVPHTPTLASGQLYTVAAEQVVALEAPTKLVVDVITSWGSGARGLHVADPTGSPESA
jgi:uncharacterized membrane protein